MTIAEYNALAQAEAVTALSPVYEKSPWIAEAVASLRPFASLAALQASLQKVVDEGTTEQQDALICAHPDLGVKFGKRSELTAESQSEQGSLGLDRLSDEAFQTFTEINAAYRDRFGFPFIICVRDNTRESILRSFETRLDNDQAAERAAALREIHRIAHHRLHDLFNDPA